MTTLLLGRRLKHLAARHSWRRVHEIGVGGYGILGIYLKKRFPELSISGSSIFEDEITSSRKVASMNSAPLELFHSDVLDRVEGRYDAIWWNLPYYDRRIVFLLDKLFGQIVEKSLLRPGGMLTLGFNSIPLDAETVLSSMRRYSYFRLIGFETFWWNPHVVMTIECHPA
ncbi:MAG: methyltransferase [Elusimicrobia bacterium]|nr:methyltransferase [Elusimicrobiota bacterium]